MTFSLGCVPVSTRQGGMSDLVLEDLQQFGDVCLFGSLQVHQLLLQVWNLLKAELIKLKENLII